MIKGRFTNIVYMGKHLHSGIEDSTNVSCMCRGIDSVPKQRGGRDCCGLYLENKYRSSVLSLFSFSLLMDIHLSMSDRHSSILVIQS